MRDRPTDIERAAREVDKLVSIATHSPYWKPETAAELSKLADRIRALASTAREPTLVSFHDRPLVERAAHARHVLEIASADRIGAMIAFSDQEHRGEDGFTRDAAALIQQEKTDAE